MSGASPRPLINAEVVANIWVYADEAGLIARVAGKAYVLDGTVKDKLELLRLLAVADFLSAEWLPTPENFELVYQDGTRLRYAQLSALSDEYAKSLLVGPMLEKLAASIPEQLREVNGEYKSFKLQMPDSPLAVITVVIERPDGQLVPVLNN